MRSKNGNSGRRSTAKKLPQIAEKRRKYAIFVKSDEEKPLDFVEK